MSGLTGDLNRLRGFSKALRRLPTVAAQKIAAAGAPELTERARASFRAGETVYGDARPSGVHGNALSLERTGRTFGTLKFTSVGTIMRCVLGTPYAKYLVRYGLLPRASSLPIKWSESLRKIAGDVLTKELQQ